MDIRSFFRKVGFNLQPVVSSTHYQSALTILAGGVIKTLPADFLRWSRPRKASQAAASLYFPEEKKIKLILQDEQYLLAWVQKALRCLYPAKTFFLFMLQEHFVSNPWKYFTSNPKDIPYQIHKNIAYQILKSNIHSLRIVRLAHLLKATPV